MAEDSDDLPDSLTSLQLFDGALARLQPARDVVTYDINSTSFYDYIDCSFVMKLPSNGHVNYTPDGIFAFPVGTVLAQTLSYADADRLGARRILETRVLLRREEKWLALTYVWNDEQTEARLELFGARAVIRRLRSDGGIVEQKHIVPDFNDCKRCHRIDSQVTPIAAGVRQLNCPSPTGANEGQLTAWQRDDLLRGAPSNHALPRLPRWNDPTTGSVEQRARAWLESNCAHCHNEGGAARHSGLRLSADVREPSSFGVLKIPVAAGRGTGGLPFDIVPGQPQLSIMLHRVRSTEAGIVMPEFGRTLVHEEGAALLSEWIESMPSDERSFAGLVGIIEELDAAEIAAWANEALAQGNARRGEAVYQREALNCKKCHAVRGSGGNVGPDLASIGAPATAAHVVESVLLPNKVIKEGFRSVTVHTEDGLALTGIQVVDSGYEIVLRDPVRGDTTIAASAIMERFDGNSLMPTNLAATLKREEFLDLVAYIVGLNAPPARDGSLSPASNP